MRLFLSFFILLCSVIWTLWSIFYYSCSKNIYCDYQINTSSNTEILTMLLWAFVLWYLFSNILSSMRTKKIIKKSKLEDIQSSYTKSKKYWLYNDNKTESNISSLDNDSSDIDNYFEKILSPIESSIPDKIELNKEIVDNSSFPKLKKKNSLLSSFIDDIDFDNNDISQKSESTKGVNKKVFRDAESKSSQIHNVSKKKMSTYSWGESIRKVHMKNNADDLTKIEWIGPKIESLLNAHNIHSFDDLANTDAYDITDMLSEAGTRFQMHNPKTWPRQATLAKKWMWDELESYQDQLKGWKE
jgi:predicted flap endonuclease-1-like 5' DNA nuclease